MEKLNRIIEELPNSAKLSVYKYTLTLKNKVERQKKERNFKFDWVGGLDEFFSEFTSFELQHKIINMWGDNVFTGH